MKCNYNGPCDFKYRNKPNESKIQQLINGLHRQIEILELNASYLHELYPEMEHHVELLGAAKITQEWLENIKATDEWLDSFNSEIQEDL